MSHSTLDWLWDFTYGGEHGTKEFDTLVERFRESHMAIVRIQDWDAFAKLTKLVFPGGDEPGWLGVAMYDWGKDRPCWAEDDLEQTPSAYAQEFDDEVKQAFEARLHPEKVEEKASDNRWWDPLTKQFEIPNTSVEWCACCDQPYDGREHPSCVPSRPAGYIEYSSNTD